MGLPIIEWLPAAHDNVSVEGLDELPSDWAQANIQFAQVRPLDQADRPDVTFSFERKIRMANLTGSVDATLTWSAVQGDYAPLNQHLVNDFTDIDWTFRAWVSAPSTAVDNVTLTLTLDGSASNATATTSTLGSSWVLLQATGRAASNTTTVGVEIKTNTAQGGTTMDVAGLFAGRCIDFEKGVRMSPDILDTRSQTTSVYGITQTDHFASYDIVSMSSHDEDAEVKTNIDEFRTHAKLGRRFGIANDRAARSKNWFPNQVLTQQRGLVVTPVGGERYRMALSETRKQTLPSEAAT